MCVCVCERIAKIKEGMTMHTNGKKKRHKKEKETKKLCIYPTPPLKARCDTKSILKQSRASLNLDFSFSSIAIQRLKSPIYHTKEM